MNRLLITISIIFSCSGLFGSYTVDSALVFADSQYLKGNFRLALKEYQRISFHTGYSEPYFQLRLANCYFRMGDQETARNYYDQVFRLAESDSLLAEARIMKISSLIRSEQYKLALIDLFGLPDLLYSNHAREFNILFGICYFGLEEFENSKSCFKKTVSGSPMAQAKIDSLFSIKKLLYRPKPGLAYGLSLILPGLGQVYSGDVGDGLNSFILAESFIILAVFVAYEYSLTDAIISVLPWYQRYFLGGTNNAREAAIRKRQRHRSNLYKKTLDIINHYP